jgi:dTDP-4-amino-4,6-dideoxygalactose transaminase
MDKTQNMTIMKGKSLTRRTFVKKTSAGAAGAAIATSGLSSLYANDIQDGNKLALLGGTPVRQRGSGLGASWPIYDDSDIQMYLDAYKSNRWSEYSNIEQERVFQFEKKYAEIMGVKYCATTNGGTTALETAQRSIDIGPGDEVITQTNTFIATALTTFNLFAIPVFIDSDPETFMIDADKIEERINKNTRAILPVHIGGAAADMDKILAIAKKHNLYVIEDACQAHMGEWRNKKLGTIGNLGCFSFQAGKSLCAGEGGAVIGDDEYLMAKAKAYTHCGRDPRGQKRGFAGSNYRLTPFQASILMGQIRRLEAQSTLRDQNSAYLEKLLAEIKGVRPTKKYPGQTRRAYYEYQMIYDKEYFNGLPKAKFQEAMRAEGIGFGNGIDSSLHSNPFIETYFNSRIFQKIYSKERLDKYRKENRCPVNEKIGSETGLHLGQRAFLGPKKDMEDIVAAIVKVQKNSSKLL